MDRQKRWSELSRPRQRAIIGAGVVQMLLAAALLDLRRRPSEQVRGSKLWAVAALVNFVGPLAYFAFGRRPS
jgi:bacteriorhodopsin